MVQDNVEGSVEDMTAEEGVWVVLKFDGTHGILGRVEGHKKLDQNTRNQILSTGSKPLCLDIAFDYAEMFRPMPVLDENGRPIAGPHGPQMQMGREPLVTNVGFIFDTCKTYVRDWTRLNFFEDMKPSDQKRYKDFRDMAIRGSEQRRAAELGLVDPRLEGLNLNDPRLKKMPNDPNGRAHFQVDLRPR